MIKIATPVSDFFRDPVKAEEISGLSFCLEGRERSMDLNVPKQYLFHFDVNVVKPWAAEERELIKRVIEGKKDLKLISFHIASNYDAPITKDELFYPGGEKFTRGRMLDNAYRNINWLKKYTDIRDIKIAVENNNYYPTPAYEYITDGDFISDVVKQNTIWFLFDLPHAMITAHNRNIGYADYVSSLPVDRMIQIHISKYSVNDKNWACDTHEAPDELIFKEVKNLIGQFIPEYITLEYYKDKDKLVGLLNKYNDLSIEKKKVI